MTERMSTVRAMRLRSDTIALEMIAENASIILSGFVVMWFDISIDGVQISPARAMLDMGVQLLLELATDFIVVVFELRLGVPLLEAWSHRRGGHRIAYAGMIVSMVVCSLVFFCNLFLSPADLGGFVAHRQ